jgi:hypothetical protein
MRPTAPLHLILLGLGVIAVASPSAAHRPLLIREAEEPVKIRLGSSPEEVKLRLGAPGRVSRQIYQLRCQEQWHFGPPHRLRVTFDCPRGQKPRVTKVHSPGGP